LSIPVAMVFGRFLFTEDIQSPGKLGNIKL
jgi:hypothetical protein